jgi:serine protease Do
MSVAPESPAARGGLQAGDAVVALDDAPIAGTHDLIARVQAISPGTDAALKIFRQGAKRTLRVRIEEMPVAAHRRDTDAPLERDLAGLTLGQLTPAAARRLSVPRGFEGAFVLAVAVDSPADDALLAGGDIIRTINGSAVHGAADAEEKLRRIKPRAPIFLLVWREGTDLFLEMRKD